MMLCLAVSLVHAEQRGKGGEKKGGQAERKPEGEEGKEEPGRESEGAHGTKSGGNKAPGGEWSERTHSGASSPQAGKENEHSAGGGAPAGNTAGKNSAASKNNNAGQASGAQGAAAGSAAAKRNSPTASGAQGAAAGAGAANRNSPAASGAQGAAAGAAAANRNPPQATGAQGAAAGAAAANRNSPAATGAQGAAAGAAAANRNSPQYSGAQGAAAGAAAANRNQPQFSGAQGAAVGAAAANLNSPALSGAAGAVTGYGAVRNSFDQPNMYSGQWYGAHPGVWAPTGWAAGAAWAPTSWGTVAGLYGYGNNAPVNYDYGGSVNYQNGNVVVNGQSVGTAAEFSQQAADLASSGVQADTSATEQWLPLGVFAMVRNENQHPQLIVQMAINEQGILRGNYTDEVTEHTLPIHGAVDKTTQRAAWTVGDNKQTVMEAGLSNLTQNEAPALIHKNGKTDHWILVRLEQPKQDGAGD